MLRAGMLLVAALAFSGAGKSRAATSRERSPAISA